MATLERLAQRVRWKKRIRVIHRFAWVLAVAVILLFLADLAFGVRTLGLRVTSAGMGLLATAAFLTLWLRKSRLDDDALGLAQLLERHYPALAERLVTVVQIEPADHHAGLVDLLRAETERGLADVDPARACPLRREGKQWLMTGALFFAMFAGLALIPSFRAFADRFTHAWTTPLTPFAISVKHGNGYALRGQTLAIEATLQRHDPHAALPTECALVCEYDSGIVAKIPMTAADGTWVAALENLRQPVRCRVEAEGVVSEMFSIAMIDPPAFIDKPSLVVTPPRYLAALPMTTLSGAVDAETIDILAYSKMHYRLPLNRKPVAARLQVVKSAEAQTDNRTEFALPVSWQDGTAEGTIDTIAKDAGVYEAAARPGYGTWSTGSLAARPLDGARRSSPRFTQPLRLHGAAGVLDPRQEYRIGPKDAAEAANRRRRR